MRGKIIMAGLIATMAVIPSVDARSLEDILKEKGVITEADYKEVAKSSPIDYKLGKGFTFTSPDGKFQLSLGGRMQYRYTFADKETGQDSSTWDAKRIRLTAQGYAYSKDLTYKMEIDPRAMASDAKKGLIDAYMDYRIINEAQVRVGQFKDCIGRQEVTSDGALQFVDRSPVIEAFKHGYDLGAMLSGKIAGGLAYYNLGVVGGAGQTNVRTSSDNAFMARVAVNPLGDMAYSEGDLDVSQKPLISLGANYLRNTVNKSAGSFDSTASNVSGWIGTFGSANDKIDTDTYGVDMAFKWMGASLQAEYLLGQAESASIGAIKRAHGFYAQAGYMIIPRKLELAVRYSYLDPNRDLANDLRTEQIGSVSYYFEKHNLKLQADVGNIHNQAGTNRDEMQYRIQAQVVF